MPAADLNISPDRCIAVPLPGEPKLSLPGFAFACATSCDTELTGRAGLTTRMVSPEAAIVIGAKSLIGSNGSFSMSVAFTVCAVTVRRIV